MKNKNNHTKIKSLHTRVFATFLISAFLFPSFFSNPQLLYAQEVDDRSKLEQELKNEQADLDRATKELGDQKKYTGKISKNLNELLIIISQKKKSILEKQKKIVELSKNISKKSTIILELTDQIKIEKSTLARLLRRKGELQNHSLTEFLFSGQTLSSYYHDNDVIKPLQGNLHGTININTENKEKTSQEKIVLESIKKNEAEKRRLLEEEKKKKEYDEKQKKVELVLSKKIEKEHELTIEEKKKKIASIKAKLFELAGYGKKGIPFGTAYQYAKESGKKTGVNPAVILAILKQESNLGKNVGGCYLTEHDTGYGVSIKDGSRKKVMKPDRDVAPFLEIAKQLGFEPSKQPVSCAFTYGWGGAMGPSQFIPSTWKVMAKRIANSVGESSANPWNPRHAIFATSLYMSDRGASGSDRESIRQAACKYYSGKSCGGNSTFYGNSVLKIMDQIQKDIDTIEN